MSVTVTYISWSSDFAMYLEEHLIYEHHTLGLYESVWPDVWPKNKCMSLWPILHGLVILPCILKTVWCMNIILWDYESVWPDIWPKILVGHCHLYFMVHWICLISWRLFDAAFALKQCRSQWSVFSWSSDFALYLKWMSYFWKMS